MATRPKLAVFKFSSCDGCQLSLLDCEDDLLAVVGAVDVAYFLEATRATAPGPYDVTLVEGSVSTPHDVERIKEVRKQSKILISIGACATSGGIQALRNMADHDDLMRYVYANPQYISALDTSKPISDYVKVDFELRGCPISKHQLLELINATLNGRKPNIPNYSQCMECKREGTVCVMVAKGEPCMGPICHAGCGNLCPSTNRGCFGCFGPKETPNATSLGNWMRDELGAEALKVRGLFHNFNANAEAFREEGKRHD